MSFVNTSGLQDWPDPASLFSAASSLMEHGASFADNVEEAHSTWKGLSACYETPNQELLYSALDPALQSGQHASDGCVSVKTAMTLFADAISELKPERDSLEAEAANFDAKPIPDGGTEFLDYEAEGQEIQRRIDSCVRKYEDAINTCAEQLSAIGDEGLPEEGSPAWVGVARDTMLAALTATAETNKVEIERIVRRVVIRLFGHDFKIPYWMTHNKSRSWDWKSWFFQDNTQGSFLTRFRTAMLEGFFGPFRGRYGDPTVIRPNRISGSWGFGKEFSSRVRTTTTAIGRTAGRAFFILGVGLTYNDEYQKADKRYREQNPELTSSDRKERVAESATVRTGSQVLAAAGAGAAIGSVIPVGGTAVGLAVGTVVGLGMMIPTGDGKNLGDRFADLGEGLWNGLKGIFGR